MSAHRWTRPNARHRNRSGKFRFAAVAPHLARTMPWGVLVVGCAAGLGISLVARQFAHPFQQPASIVLTIRAAFIPIAAAVAFLPADPHRSLTAALPAPVWLSVAGRLVIALPLLGLTGWIQLQLANTELPIVFRNQGMTSVHLPWPALVAELIAWSAIAVAAAALVTRTRWNDLGGAIAAPAALAFIGLLAATPLGLVPVAFAGLTLRQHNAWLRAEWSWWSLSLIAALVAGWANRDPWLRLKSARHS